MRGLRRALSVLLCLASFGVCGEALAQGPRPEAIDETRLDVERLPPEALAIDRDMFSRGLLVTGQLGGRGFVGGVGRLSDPGLWASAALGWEWASWFSTSVLTELSLHRTSAPAPPVGGAFELLDLLLELRLTLPLSARAALWLAPQGGLELATGDLLRVYGFPDADGLGLVYGGALGFDWHLLSRHHSMGLLAGARQHPNLDGPGTERAIAVHSAAYLKYVF